MGDNENKGTDIVAELENIMAQLSIARERALELREEVARMDGQVKAGLARGTGDVTEAARVVAATLTAAAPPAQHAVPATLAQRIEEVLRNRVATTEDLARELRANPTRIQKEIAGMRKQIADVGTAARAEWSWRLGDAAPPVALRALVRRLISRRPFELRELVVATGARESLVHGHLVELQRAGGVLNLGEPRRARWFLVPGAPR